MEGSGKKAILAGTVPGCPYPAPASSYCEGSTYKRIDALTYRARMAARRPLPPPARFDAAASRARLASEEFDVVVVGGGITGCGVALDAVTRGLRTALVEAADLASGTSSRSSKFVHGGLRYLHQRELGLVSEALTERQTLLRNAPHLVRPLPFCVPLFGREGVVAEGIARAYSTALWLYDLSGGVRIGHRHHRTTAEDTLQHVPGLRADRLVASFVYWDAQADDARLTLAVARTAAVHGAVIATRAPATALLRRPGGRVGGVRLADGTTVRARAVVNAAGVWSEEVASLPGSPADSRVPHLRPAKGVHLAFPSHRLPCSWATVLTVPGERRTIFVAPWDAQGVDAPSAPGRYTYVGTTDSDYEGGLRSPGCDDADIDSLLATVNTWTTARLTRQDVTGSWAGLRPLLAGDHHVRSADLSRRHRVVTSTDGLVTVTGGKLTTYRRMAEDTVDALLPLLGVRRQAHRCRTGRLPLVGALAWERVPHGGPLLGHRDIHHHLVGRYGAEAGAVVGMCGADPSLAQPLVPGLPYLRAEAVWAVRREMAVSLEDVLARRTRAALLDRAATVAAAPDVARLLATELGWDERRVAEEVDAVQRSLEVGPDSRLLRKAT